MPRPGRRSLGRHIEWRKRQSPKSIGTRSDRWAWPISTAAHWAYGSSAAAMYGVVAGSARRPRPAYGLPFGATVWASGYVVLPQAGLYQPIWKYDAKTLAWDLSAHLAYGAGTGTTFWLLTKII